jgi:hypothetical protein
VTPRQLVYCRKQAGGSVVGCGAGAGRGCRAGDLLVVDLVEPGGLEADPTDGQPENLLGGLIDE